VGPSDDSIPRLRRDLGTLWRAASRRSIDARVLGANATVTPETLANALVPVRPAADEDPRYVAAMLKAHEALAGSLFPATPESIRLCEAYLGAAPASAQPDALQARRQAMRMRRRFTALIALALLALCLSVGLTFEAVVGSSAFTAAREAVDTLAQLRASLNTSRGANQADQSRLTGEVNDAEQRAASATRDLARWNDTISQFLLLPATAPTATPELVLARATALLALLTHFGIPLLEGFLGVFCNFARWFSERLTAMALSPGDTVPIVVRFLVGISATLLASLIFVAIDPSPSGRWIMYPAAAFLLGYFTPYLFGWLDAFIGTRPARILVAQLERKAVQAIDEKLSQPTLTNFTGRVGVDLKDEAGQSLLRGETEAVPFLLAGKRYTLEVQIGREVAGLPRTEALLVTGGQDEVEAVFDVELATQLEASPRTASTVPIATAPTGKAASAWTHAFSLTVPADWQGGTEDRETIWVTVRQHGYACATVDIPTRVIPPAPRPFAIGASSGESTPSPGAAF
jgi:hypothetical protein